MHGVRALLDLGSSSSSAFVDTLDVTALENTLRASF